MSQVARHTLIGQPSAPVYVLARAMQSISAAPELNWLGSSNSDRVNVYYFDAAVVEDLGFSVALPSDWATVSAAVVWVNRAASTGDVRWFLNWTVAGDGDSATVQTGSHEMVDSAPATVGPLRFTTVEPAVPVTAGKLTVMRLRRAADHATDTLPNDAGVLGVLLRKAP